MKFLMVLIGVFAINSQSIAGDVQTVKYVDLKSYLGTWYEIGSIPQFFQKDCFCSRAEYSLNEDGSVNVKNTCNKYSPEGKESIANGKAKVVDVESNSKLKVTFFWPFYGDYWIIGLDEQYRYSVVSSPDRSTLWILSRTPVLEPTLLKRAFRDAESQGLDLSKLVYGDNKSCKYQLRSNEFGI